MLRKRYQSVFFIGEFALALYWCAFLIGGDSYPIAYLAPGLLGLACLASNPQRSCRQIPKTDKLLTCVLAAFAALAVLLANYHMFPTYVADRYMLLRTFCSIVFVFAGGCVLFYQILFKIYWFQRSRISPASFALEQPKMFWLCFFSLSAVYFCVFWGALYPGVLTNDSIWQLEQILTGNYSNHHPFYHTQVIRIFIHIGLAIFGDLTKAVALFSVVSLVVMAAVFSYVVCTVYQYTSRKRLALIILLFYLLMPYHIIYSVTMWKDVFFSAAVTLFITAIFRILKGIGSHHKRDLVILLISSFGFCLWRSNGFLAFATTVGVLALFYRHQYQKVLFALLAVLLLSLGLKGPVLNALHITPVDRIESLSIPIQQISRVVNDDFSLSPQEKSLLCEVVNLEDIKQSYYPAISDPMKDLLREHGFTDQLETHLFDYLKLYVSLGLRYPQEYLKAWIDQTVGYWDGGYNYWRWKTDIAPNSLGLTRIIHIPAISNFLEQYTYIFEYTTFFPLFLCIGLFAWILIFSAYGAYVHKDYAALFICAPNLFLLLTLLIATPVYAEFRYAYSLFCSVPVWICAGFFGIQAKTV